jgi:tight adherence protein B
MRPASRAEDRGLPLPTVRLRRASPALLSTLLLALLMTILPAATAGASDLSLSIAKFEPPYLPNATATVQLGGPAAAGQPLPPEAFSVLVDGRPVQKVSVNVLGGEPLPSATALVLDESGSMWNKKNRGEPTKAAIRAASEFVSQMGEKDLVTVFVFDHEVRQAHDFSGDKGELTASIEGLRPDGGDTALYDAVIEALDALAQVPAAYAKHLILLSDGTDDGSKNTLDAALSRARASGVVLYAVGFKTAEFNSEAMSQLAEVTGGRYLEATDGGSLSDLYRTLAVEIHNHYALTFALPQGARDGSQGTLEVSVAHQGANASDQAGFVYPVAPAAVPVAEAAPQVALIPEPAAPGLAAAFVSWEGSAPVLALLVFAFLLLLGYLLSATLFPKPDVLNDYADILDNRGRLAPRSLDPDSGGRPGESVVARMLALRDYQGPLQRRLEDAGWQVRSSEFALFHLAFVAAVSLAVIIIGAGFWMSALLVVLAVICPLLLLDMKVSRRRKAFEGQIGDVLVLMANSLRVGQGFEQALQVVAAEGPAPAREEFHRLLSQQQLGVAPEVALETLAERMDSDAFRWVVLATVIQRQAGGNLAELYERVAETLREREKLQGEVDTLTAEAKMSALILIALPFGVAFMVQLLNPEYLEVLYKTTPGRVVVAGALLAMATGVLWMRRIIDFDL